MSSQGRGWLRSQDGGRPGPPFSNQKTQQKSANNPGQGDRVTSPENHESSRPLSGDRNSKKFENNKHSGARGRQSSGNVRPDSSDKNCSGSRAFTMSTKVDNWATESTVQPPAEETRIDTESGLFHCTENPRDVEKGNRRDSNVTKNTRRNSRGREKSTSSKDSLFLKEVEEDLFAAEDDVSLVHCVGADFRMGSGIAIKFRQKFGSVGKLLDQRARPGDVACIESRQRWVFYLVTKQASTDKPTNETMRKSLVSLRKKCKDLCVTKLAMPHIGCGLDGLLWEDVKEMLLEIFADGFTITIYDLKMDLVDKPKRGSKQRVSNNKLFLKDIEPGTGLLYIGCEDKSVTDEMRSLDEKYRFIGRLKKWKYHSLKLGTVFRSEIRNETLFGLICKKSATSSLNYHYLETAIQNLNQYKYDYYGIQAFEEKDDPYVMEKIDTLLRNSSVNAEFWICWPPSLEQKCPSKPEKVQENMEVDENQHFSKTDQESRLPVSNFSKKSMESENSYNQYERATTQVEEQMTAQSLSNEDGESWEKYVNEEPPPVVSNALNTDKIDQFMEDQSVATPSEADDSAADSSWNNSRFETNPDDAATNPEDYAAAEKRRSKAKKEANQLMKRKEKQDSRIAKPESCITEHSGDLFETDDTMCLAHCVGADFRMGSGIAVIFRQRFGSVPELLAQRVNQGGVAVIQHEKRYIFYLVTKKESTGKPTYPSLKKSLEALHDKCKQMNITELAMPRIGCGLDRLNWRDVKPMIEDIFSDGFSIHVYNLEKPPYSNPSNGDGSRFWSGTQISNNEPSGISKDMHRRLDSMNSQLCETKNTLKKAIESVESKIERLMNHNSSEKRELLGAIAILTTKMENRFENLEQRMEAVEIESQNQKAIIEKLERRLQEKEIIPHVSKSSYDSGQSRRYHKSYAGCHQRFGYQAAPPPLVSNIGTTQAFPGVNVQYYPGAVPVYPTIDNEMSEYWGYANPNSAGEYVKRSNNSAMFATETLQPEREALLRTTREAASAHGYKVTERNGNIMVAKDDHSKPMLITSYNDLKRFGG